MEVQEEKQGDQFGIFLHLISGYLFVYVYPSVSAEINFCFDGCVLPSPIR